MTRGGEFCLWPQGGLKVAKESGKEDIKKKGENKVKDEKKNKVHGGPRKSEMW